MKLYESYPQCMIIPGEVAFNKNLTYLEKYVFWFIKEWVLRNENSTCNATNKCISVFLGTSDKTISIAISKLKEEGYLLSNSDSMLGFRILKINQDYKIKHKCHISDFWEYGESKC